MRLLAIILNYRTPKLTERAIDTALQALERVPDSELVVVDNDSADGSFEQLTAFMRTRDHRGRARVVQSGRNGGFGFGNNFAIRPALAASDPPDFVYILNSDAFPSEDAISTLLSYLEAHRQVGIVGSYIHGVDGAPHGTAFRFPSIASEFEQGLHLGLVSRLLAARRVSLGALPYTAPVDWVSGASFMVRASVLRQVGLFDETFFLYFEETDLCRRASRQGFQTVYVRESVVAHVGSASTGIQDRGQPRPGYWFDSRAYYYQQNHGKLYHLAADLARVVGGMGFRARRFVQRGETRDPPGFLRDFLTHALRQRLPR